MTPLAAANRRGIVARAGAMACFIANDAVVKLASAAMPTAQLIFLRGTMATAIVLAVAFATGALARARDTVHRSVVVRALAEALATVLYLTALFQLPIANAAAINLSTPGPVTLTSLAPQVVVGSWMFADG